jgi:Glycosyltransferase family 87
MTIRRLSRIAFIGGAVGLLVGIVLYGIVVLGYGPADGYTYLAAGERLNSGHPLYALSPGDRPVDIRPPYWTVPLLSPPPVAVLFRPLAALPNELGLRLWWLGCVIAIAVALGVMFRVRPVLMSAAVLVFLLPLEFEIPTANVNGFLLLAVVMTWLLARSGRDGAAGAVIAAAAAVKLTPAILIVWFLSQRRWTAVRAFLVVGAALLLVSLAGAGVGAHLDYLAVIGQTGSVGTTQFSLAGLLRTVGVPAEAARFAPVVVDGVGIALMWWGRDRPSFTYSVAVFTMVWGSPVVNFDWLTLMLGALAPGLWPMTARSHPTSAAPALAAV